MLGACRSIPEAATRMVQTSHGELREQMSTAARQASRFSATTSTAFTARMRRPAPTFSQQFIQPQCRPADFVALPIVLLSPKYAC
jgi:hypothetical protein